MIRSFKLEIVGQSNCHHDTNMSKEITSLNQILFMNFDTCFILILKLQNVILQKFVSLKLDDPTYSILHVTSNTCPLDVFR